MQKSRSMISIGFLLVIALSATVFFFGGDHFTADDRKNPDIATSYDSDGTSLSALGNPEASVFNTFESDPLQAEDLLRQSVFNASQQYQGLGKIPDYLSDVDTDARLLFDESGKLYPTPGLKDLFNFYLSSIGDESLESIVIRIANFLTENYPANIAEQAWEHLGKYVDYKNVLELESENLGGQESLRSRMAMISAIRKQELGLEAAEGYFGIDEQYDQFALDLMDITSIQYRDEEERQEQISLLEQNLPADLRDIRQQAVRLNNLHQQVAVLKDDDASGEEIFLLRENAVGSEAAIRLGVLDQQRQIWQSRYELYRDEYEAVFDSKLSGLDKEGELQRLREKHFSESEKRRVITLDKIASLESEK